MATPLDDASAWEIASQAGSVLCGNVHFECDEELGWCRKTYAWLEIDVLSIESLEWIQHKREACALWHMLECCDGFGGHENDVFWKRVVDEFDHHDVEATWGATDAFPFFPNLPFPRYRLVFPPLKPAKLAFAVRAFFGLAGAAQIPSFHPNSWLENAAATLRPYVDTTRFEQQVVDVGIVIVSYASLSSIANTIKDVVQALENRAPTATDDQLKFPRVRLADVTVYGVCSKDTELRALTRFVTRCAVNIPEVKIMPSHAHTTQKALTNRLAALCTGVARVQTLNVQLNDASPRQIETIFSALPTINVQHLNVCFGGDQDEYAWAWLAYAAFHRDSRFQYLYISRALTPTAAPMRSIRAAFTSHYRLAYGGEDAAEAIEEDGNAEFAFVRVAAETKCFKDDTLYGKILVTTKTKPTLTAIIPSVVHDVHDLPCAVCVVVPGSGHGWISRYNVLDMQFHAARHGGLRGLGLVAAENR